MSKLSLNIEDSRSRTVLARAGGWKSLGAALACCTLFDIVTLHTASTTNGFRRVNMSIA